MDVNGLLDRIAAGYRAALGENYVGLYVHGSVAMGCFNPACSDVDYICVVEREPDDAAKRAVLAVTLELEAAAPCKGLEMHILRREDCLRPRHPVCFCLHYSGMHRQWCLRDIDDYVARMKGGDPDLAAHLTVMRARGLRWDGPPVGEVFGPVPHEDYVDSILYDVEDDSGAPMYRILNLGRTLAALNGAGVLSKREGGQWLLAMPEPLPEGGAALVREALACYAEGRAMPPSDGTRALCEELLERIHALARRK